MKLMPASRALATTRDEVASSVGPPNIMVPKQIGEIFRPLRPSWRYCMASWFSDLDRHCERSEAIHITAQRKNGLLRRFAPRNDGGCYVSLFNILNTPLAIAITRFSTVTSVVMKIRLRVERTTRG